MGLCWHFLLDEHGTVQSQFKEGFNPGVCAVVDYLPGHDATVVILANQTCDVMGMDREVRKLLPGLT